MKLKQKLIKTTQTFKKRKKERNRNTRKLLKFHLKECLKIKTSIECTFLLK